MITLLMVIIALTFSSVKANAEGTTQMNEWQEISDSTDVFIDILNEGEVINISFCENNNITIYDVNETPDFFDDDIEVSSGEHSANLDCEDLLPSPILGAYKFTPAEVGTYRIDFDDDSDRFDFSVTPDTDTEPDPANDSGGRVWSYLWRFSAQSSDDPQEYPESTSTDADLFAVVPGPNDGESFVWKLDLNNFAGGSYRLMANSIGLEPPYSGVSAWIEDADVLPEYPIYLSYPEKTIIQNTATPTISNFSFLDDEGEDDTFSPGTTIGVQDSGVFSFTSNVDNATYAITVDTNKDGIFGTGDRVLLGNATSGVNDVTWDGNFADGNPVPVGNYSARIQLRIGEFHFVARDVEASGGTYDNITWANGLTIYRATGPNTQENTTIFWDDLSYLRVIVPGDEEDIKTDDLYSDATSNLPNGVISGSTADANNDGKADGFHTWGDFEAGSMGDLNFIDTYAYGAVDSETTTLSVATIDGADDDGVSSGIEAGAPNDGDGNDDGTPDHLQNDVTSLPNPVVGGGAYTTLQVEGCLGLEDVSISAEASLSEQDEEHDYPVGLLNFEAYCLTPGETANITIFYDKIYDTSTWQARKFTNGVYGEIPGAVFGTADIGGTQVTTLTYSVTDGGPLDEDGTLNGTIVDPVGPGIAVAGETGSTGSLPTTGTDAQFDIATALLLMALGSAISIGIKMRSRKQNSLRRTF